MQSALGLDEPANLFERIWQWVFVYLEKGWAWLDANIFTYESAGQLGLVALLFGLSHLLARWVHKAADQIFALYPSVEKARHYIEPLFTPLIALILILIAKVVWAQFDLRTIMLDSVTSLLIAWIVIRFAANFIANPLFSRAFTATAWTIAALDIFGVLAPIIDALQGAAVDVGEARISMFDLISGVLTFIIAIWAALLATRLIDARLLKASSITPSARVLIGKVAKISLVTLAILIALNSTGIDLTALAVFGGALGVGIGFGLQKVVSNFISGVILLLDRSIKPGDVIEIQGTYGAINALAARYTSVITRDGTEYLIPNEDMITQPVINWSHSNTQVRLRLPVNVAYQSNLSEAMEHMCEAAANNPRILSYPKPRALLKGFGDNGVDLELRIWINDPQNGVANVGSEVLMAVWDRFHEHGIEFPFPQRVVHFAPDTKLQTSASD